MIEMEKKYQTRDGRAVRILATDMKSGDAPIIGPVTMQNGSELVECWRSSGRSLELGVTESPSDLIPVLTKHQGWGILRMVRGLCATVFLLDGMVFKDKTSAERVLDKERADHPNQKYGLASVTWED
jgi:hypothetical protein